MQITNYRQLLLKADKFLIRINQTQTLPASPLVSHSLILRALFEVYSEANLCDFQCWLYPNSKIHEHTEIKWN